MTSIADTSVKIQTTSESNPSPPAWFGEIVIINRHLQKHGILSKINEQVRFARKRFGRYEVIDFLAVQIALCHQWRTHPGGLLRAPPAAGGPIHGPLWPQTGALALRIVPFFSGAGSGLW